MTAENMNFKEAYGLYQEIQRNTAFYAKQAVAIRDKQYANLSYSKNYFIPLTYWCRNDCLYCQFRKTTGVPYISVTEVQACLEEAKKTNCSEILITMGEKPEERFLAARTWLESHGYASTIDYLIHICEMALDADLLPHSNPGVLTYSELEKLANVNASMGLMLETTSQRLLSPGYAHAKSPTKNPEKRLEVIRNAGKLRIPFTTGLLIGIGETSKEIVDGIFAIRELNNQYNHIQEVIIQNLVIPKSWEKVPSLQSCSPEKLQSVVILARLLLNPTISVQVPPNLNRGFEEQLITSGINDWGGISQVTIDHVNPQAPWPEYKHLEDISQRHGFVLAERLPVYPNFVNSHWLRPNVLSIAKKRQLALEIQAQQLQNASS
ncbi:MAG: 7,8-didemethyl-8-hydroxy-5-deazariboflavin synthase subunit CofG [Candidatus Hodarchaeales archaeon]